MFKKLLLGLFTAATLSDYLGDTSLRTIKRWQSQDRAPQAVTMMLKLLHGDLGLIHPDWQGWILHQDGNLYSPNGDKFHTGQIQSLIFQWQLTRELKRKNRELEKQLGHQQFMFTASNDAVN